MADNLNISPDMINNLINMLKNGSNNQSDQNTPRESSTGTNQKNQYETNINNEYNTNSKSANSSVNIDFETIMKMKYIMESLNNSNDQNSKLLYSLKPYLRKSRQEKLDQYINIFKIAQVSKLFNTKNEKKSDSDNII